MVVPPETRSERFEPIEYRRRAPFGAGRRDRWRIE
jgi:hypothetical protein